MGFSIDDLRRELLEARRSVGLDAVLDAPLYAKGARYLRRLGFQREAGETDCLGR